LITVKKLIGKASNPSPTPLNFEKVRSTTLGKEEKQKLGKSRFLSHTLAFS